MQHLLQNASAFLLQTATVLLQNAMVLLQNAAIITKCNVYYKMRQYIHPPNKTQAVNWNQFFF